MFCDCYITGVEISLMATTYTAFESDGNQDVCAVLSSRTQIPVSIGLLTMDGSAIGMFCLSWDVLERGSVAIFISVSLTHACICILS